jgi:hypothetical protein
MKYLLVSVVSLLVFRILWLAIVLFGIWTSWQSWRRIYDAEAVWLEVAECMRSQGIVPQQTEHWERTRRLHAYCYGGIGLIAITLGIRLLTTATP